VPDPPLAGRRLLVTAGPTWVLLDAVRHMANLSTGGTGLAIARAAAAAGARVTLLHGPGQARPTDSDRSALHVIDFVTFDDLHAAVREQIGTRTFDAMVHTAAVSDYRPAAPEAGKLPSGAEEWTLRLRPTPKIVDEVRGLDPDVLLVKFKLEVGKTEAELLEIAARSRDRSDADLMVANDIATFRDGHRPAYLLDRTGLRARTGSLSELAERLVAEIAVRLAERPARDAAGNRE
jgi:phosphopantothenoylcysteine synthetase/decarboxylase